MSAAPWFKDGLRFECTQCGNCCTGSPGYVWVTDDEVLQIAEYLEKPIGEVRLLHTRPARGKVSLKEYANGDCIYFDPQSRGCRIYPVRPTQCRTWPFWNTNVQSPEQWQATQQSCPGAGQGQFISLEEIEDRLSQTDL